MEAFLCGSVVGGSSASRFAMWAVHSSWPYYYQMRDDLGTNG
jgi:hypothetical protein